MLAARQHRRATHHRCMIRSFSLTFGAVTLRVYLPGSTHLGFFCEDVYPCIARLAWVPNLFVAELRSLRQAAPKRGGTADEVERAEIVRAC